MIKWTVESPPIVGWGAMLGKLAEFRRKMTRGRYWYVLSVRYKDGTTAVFSDLVGVHRRGDVLIVKTAGGQGGRLAVTAIPLAEVQEITERVRPRAQLLQRRDVDGL